MTMPTSATLERELISTPPASLELIRQTFVIGPGRDVPSETIRNFLVGDSSSWNPTWNGIHPQTKRDRTRAQRET